MEASPEKSSGHIYQQRAVSSELCKQRLILVHVYSRARRISSSDISSGCLPGPASIWRIWHRPARRCAAACLAGLVSIQH
jgi:hypothetical protein